MAKCSGLGSLGSFSLHPHNPTAPLAALAPSMQFRVLVISYQAVPNMVRLLVGPPLSPPPLFLPAPPVLTYGAVPGPIYQAIPFRWAWESGLPRGSTCLMETWAAFQKTRLPQAFNQVLEGAQLFLQSFCL